MKAEEADVATTACRQLYREQGYARRAPYGTAADYANLVGTCDKPK